MKKKIPRFKEIDSDTIYYMLKVINSCNTPEQLANTSLWAIGRLNEWEEFDKRDIWKTGIAYEWLRFIREKYEPFYDSIQNVVQKRLVEMSNDTKINEDIL